jgi:hypothetical protein
MSPLRTSPGTVGVGSAWDTAHTVVDRSWHSSELRYDKFPARGTNSPSVKHLSTVLKHLQNLTSSEKTKYDTCSTLTRFRSYIALYIDLNLMTFQFTTYGISIMIF